MLRQTLSRSQISHALLPQSNHRRHHSSAPDLARDRDSAYHLSRVSESTRPIVAVVGPTASGKSGLGIELALRIGGEIINCDSVQVYQGIHIATAKVPLEERRGIPHHLIDFVSPAVNFTAADWARAAIEKIGEIEDRKHSALLVGGTGFYLGALRRPFFASPPTDEQVRARLTAIRERRGPEHLHQILQRLDAAEAAKLNARDWPRVQRAIEVCLQTGEPISRLRPLRAEPPSLATRIQIIALNPPRNELYARINARAETHFANGLVEEVRGLLDQGVPANSNALGAHGYRRVVEYLNAQRDLESAVEQTKLDVRHYAKRQLTWFRHVPAVQWLDGFGDDPQVVERALALIQPPGG